MVRPSLSISRVNMNPHCHPRASIGGGEVGEISPWLYSGSINIIVKLYKISQNKYFFLILYLLKNILFLPSDFFYPWLWTSELITLLLWFYGNMEYSGGASAVSTNFLLFNLMFIEWYFYWFYWFILIKYLFYRS